MITFLLRHRQRIFRSALWMLLGGLLSAAFGLLFAPSGVNWNTAQIRSLAQVPVSLSEDGRSFTAHAPEGGLLFYCAESPFCRRLAENRRRSGAAEPLRADLRYLAPEEGRVLLEASFADAGNGGERVSLRSPPASVDAQAALVEYEAGRTARLAAYARHFFFTLFAVFMLLRAYLWIWNRILHR